MKLTRLFAIALLISALPLTHLRAQELTGHEDGSVIENQLGADAPAVHGQPDLDRASRPEHGEEKSGGLPQMDVSTFPSQLFWLAVNFGLLFLLMWRVALPQVTATFHKRACALQEALTAAHQARTRAQSLRDHAGQLTSTANDDVKKLMDKLNSEILGEQQKREKELLQVMQAKQAESEQVINQLIEEAEHQIPAEAASLAEVVIEKLTPLRPSADQVRQATHAIPAPVLGKAA